MNKKLNYLKWNKYLRKKGERTDILTDATGQCIQVLGP